MNTIILIGRLTKDPDIRTTGKGKPVASFGLAVPPYPGAPKEETDFVPIVAYDKPAEITGDNLNKGRRVAVKGRLHIYSYEKDDGQKRRVAEVIADSIDFLDAKKSETAVVEDSNNKPQKASRSKKSPTVGC
jgi:single-strand DNA-binding protein